MIESSREKKHAKILAGARSDNLSFADIGALNRFHRGRSGKPPTLSFDGTHRCATGTSF